MAHLTPRGGPASKRLRPHIADENMEQTYVDPTMNSFHLVDASNDEDSLAFFSNQGSVKNVDFNMVVDSKENLFGSPKKTPVSTTKVEVVSSPKAFGSPKEDVLTPRDDVINTPKAEDASNTKTDVLNTPRTAVANTPKSEVFDTPKTAVYNTSKEVTPKADVTSSPTTAINISNPEVEDAFSKFDLATASEVSLFVIPEVAGTQEADISMKNKTIEVDENRVFKITNLIRDVCIDLSIKTDYRDNIMEKVDILEFNFIEYLTGKKDILDEVTSNTNDFVNFIVDTAKNDIAERLKSLHQKELDDYKYMYELEKDKKNDLDKKLKLIQTDNIESPQSPAKNDALKNKFDLVSKQLETLRAYTDKTDELEVQNETLEYENGLLKLYAKLITTEEAKKLYGDDVLDRLNDYLKNQSKI